jgi:hypothetical protein
LPLLAAIGIAAWLAASTLHAGAPVGGASSIVCDENGVCEEHVTIICPPRTFAWGGGATGHGGECWSKGDSSRFASWLKRHGSSPQRFRERFPELARIFGPKWGTVKPAWKDCYSASCVPAVIEHVFGASASYAKAIAYCESRYYPHAVGAAGERGIFQIHPVHFGSVDESRLFEPLYNARFAWRMSRGGTSWAPWTCSRMV